eukprot:15328476-Ditylum_brightwellii.AAC.1
MSGCGVAVGRTLAGVWRSSGGGICFCTWCVGVAICLRDFLWSARRRWQVAAVRWFWLQCLGSVCGNCVVCHGSIGLSRKIAKRSSCYKKHTLWAPVSLSLGEP